MSTPAPKFYSVPAGTPPSQCRGSSCRAVIYWITNPSTGRMIPRHPGNLAYVFGLDDVARAQLRTLHRGGQPYPKRRAA